mmetsp:Transcript_18488/g.29476  ORF Transcript_18488/g.29476 Transcript_18488/m.29476 type:complete len:462 (-) Transcript_18488:377-1762(-)
MALALVFGLYFLSFCPLSCVSVGSRPLKRINSAVFGKLSRRISRYTAASALKVGIVGAGPAGLSMAKALQELDTGVDEVTVFDRGDALKPELGGGIQINGGAAVLAKLGLGDEIKAAGLPVKGIRSRTVAGNELFAIDVGEAFQGESELMHEGTPMAFTIMRDALQRVLADSIPEKTISLNKKLVSVNENTDQVKCTFQDGTTYEFDLLIGADGIRSEVKRQVWAGSNLDLNPKYSQIRIQFGVAKGWHLTDSQEMQQWFGDGTYALAAQYKGVNGQPFEMIALVFADPNEVSENANWEKGEVQLDCVNRLKASKNPPEVIQLAQRCDRFYELGVHYYPALQPWVSSKGRVILIGDAAHAMPPFLGQGANQAIQDAYCLAVKLAELKSGKISSLSEAARSYEISRKPPTAALQLESRLLGFLETAGGPGTIPASMRDIFFFVLGKLGIAKKTFVTGAVPRV